jgi:hypothetical protein
MFKELARQSADAILCFLFPKWMKRLKQEVREEEFRMAMQEQAEAREGGLGTRIYPPKRTTEIRGGRAEGS